MSSSNDDVIDIVYDPCGAIELRAAPDTLAEELVAIDEAIAFWEDVANVRISRVPALDDQVIDVRFEDAALLFRGLYDDEMGDVIVNRQLSNPKDRAVTVAHELGHALGLPHIDSRDSVMNSGNLHILPLAADVDELGTLWGPCVQIDAASPEAPWSLRTRFRTHSRE